MILKYSKTQWKKYIKNAVKEVVFKHLTSENALLEHTKEIVFNELKTSEYLLDNRNTSLSKIIFSLRSKTFDIKKWQPWKYHDNLCVACELKEENMNHFLTCTSYESLSPENNWEQVKENDTSVERQFEIAKIVKARQLKRKKIIENFEAGHPQDNPGSRAPVSC